MKICQERIDDAKLKRRINEEIDFAALRCRPQAVDVPELVAQHIEERLVVRAKLVTVEVRDLLGIKP